MLALQKRLFELFTASIVISVVIAVLFLLEFIPATEYNMAFVCTIGTGVFILINMRQLQRCTVDLVSLKLYYKYNYLSYLIFGAVSTIICGAAPVELFSVMFSFTKFVRYACAAVSYKKSLLIFHAVMLFVIAVTPFFLPEKYREQILKKKAYIKENKRRVILCPTCKTGAESYALDDSSPVCPYLSVYNGMRCSYYIPIEKK